MNTDYSRGVGRLSDQQRLHFYELFAHNLTVVIRGILSDVEASEAVKVERIERVNEILHRITAKVWVLRLNSHTWSEEETWAMVADYVAEDEMVAVAVSGAIKWSYEGGVNEFDRI